MCVSVWERERATYLYCTLYSGIMKFLPAKTALNVAWKLQFYPKMPFNHFSFTWDGCSEYVVQVWDENLYFLIDFKYEAAVVAVNKYLSNIQLSDSIHTRAQCILRYLLCKYHESTASARTIVRKKYLNFKFEYFDVI